MHEPRFLDDIVWVATFKLFSFVPLQADANVRVHLTDKGEHVLVTAGEVHLERCLRDLRETYAGIEVVASEPGLFIGLELFLK